MVLNPEVPARPAVYGLDHAALDGWKLRHENRGVAVEGPIDHGMFRSIYFHDPNGYRLEFASTEAKEKAVFEAHGARAHELMRS